MQCERGNEGSDRQQLLQPAGEGEHDDDNNEDDGDEEEKCQSGTQRALKELRIVTVGTADKTKSNEGMLSKK